MIQYRASILSAPRAAAAYHSYRRRVESDGGVVVNPERIRDFFEWSIENEIKFGVVTAPWAGVKLDGSGNLEKAYSLLPYAPGVYFDPVQATAASRPEQVGETWVFDGVDDFLSVDLMSNKNEITCFASIDTPLDAVRTILGQGDSTNENERYRLMTRPGEYRFRINTGSGPVVIDEEGVDISNLIGVVSASDMSLYTAGALFNSKPAVMQSAGDTVFRIGNRAGSAEWFEGKIIGAAGMFHDVLTSQQVSEFNLLM